MSNKDQAVPFTTPTGRLLWGNLYEPKTEDFEGNPMLIKSGPDAGKPTQAYEFGVAFPKNGTTHFSQMPANADGSPGLGLVVWQTGHRDHPQMAQRPDFSWKITDGDSKIPGKPYKGKPSPAPCEKEGYPGHWVFSFRSSYPPKIVTSDGSAYILDKDAVVPGDWVQVAGSVVGNTGANAGVYLNHNFVALQYKGVPIVTGKDPKTLGFGGGGVPAGYVAPTGQMAAPPVAGAPAPGGQPAAPVAAAPVPGVPAVNAAPVVPAAGVPAAAAAPLPVASAAQTSPSSPVAVVPHPGILLPPGAPALPVPVPVPLAPPPGPVLSAALAAAGHTWASLLQAGWSEATARAAGHIV